MFVADSFTRNDVFMHFFVYFTFCYIFFVLNNGHVFKLIQELLEAIGPKGGAFRTNENTIFDAIYIQRLNCFWFASEAFLYKNKVGFLMHELTLMFKSFFPTSIVNRS